MSYTHGLVLTPKLIEEKYNTFEKLFDLVTDADEYIFNNNLHKDEDAQLSIDCSVLQMGEHITNMLQLVSHSRAVINSELYSQYAQDEEDSSDDEDVEYEDDGIVEDIE